MDDGGRMSYVQKVIHSLVVSSPERMTIERLMRDYRSEEGCDVPYGKLGFRDIESFLRAIPDTVVVVGHGPTASVLAVPTANSAHIQKLVQGQKKPSKSRNRGKLKPKFRNMKMQQQLLQQAPRPAAVIYPNINALISAGQQEQQVQVVSHGPTAGVLAVSTANSAPIQNLVQCQKKSKKSRNRRKPAPVIYPNINALISAKQQLVLNCYKLLWYFSDPYPYPYLQNVQRAHLPPNYI